MAWPPFVSRDRKSPLITRCTHSRVASLRLEGNFVSDDSGQVVLTQTPLSAE